MLVNERNRLKDLDAFTIIDYIKTSIEILMNMKVDDCNSKDQNKESKSKESKANSGGSGEETSN